MSSIKPLVLYSHATGPNPWKVAIILKELDIPYETKFIEFPDMKKEPYLSLNPNGRAPALQDPNTGITLWESGAIIDYLIDQYDKDAKLHYTTLPEKYVTRSWEHFQMSGQGPYFGQKAWFSHFHAEKNITSAIDRYANEIARVTGVIDAHLTKQGTPYLVGDKITYADLMFVTWSSLVPWLHPDLDLTKYPKYSEWLQRLVSRPAVAAVLEEKKAKSAQK